MHPWEKISLSDYEAHMGLDEVFQLQQLSEILRAQLCDYKVTTAAILGIAGGNGLEHVSTTGLKTVYGLDINAEYLAACKERYGHFGERLQLVRCDLSQPDACLPQAELIVANLFIEYIGLARFVSHIANTQPRYVTCVIQHNLGEQFVSHSPYTHVFDEIGALHSDIAEQSLTAAMEETAYDRVLRTAIALPNAKQFIRLDFCKR